MGSIGMLLIPFVPLMLAMGIALLGFNQLEKKSKPLLIYLKGKGWKMRLIGQKYFQSFGHHKISSILCAIAIMYLLIGAITFQAERQFMEITNYIDSENGEYLGFSGSKYELQTYNTRIGELKHDLIEKYSSFGLSTWHYHEDAYIETILFQTIPDLIMGVQHLIDPTFYISEEDLSDNFFIGGSRADLMSQLATANTTIAPMGYQAMGGKIGDIVHFAYYDYESRVHRLNLTVIGFYTVFPTILRGSSDFLINRALYQAPLIERLHLILFPDSVEFSKGKFSLQFLISTFRY